MAVEWGDGGKIWVRCASFWASEEIYSVGLYFDEFG